MRAGKLFLHGDVEADTEEENGNTQGYGGFAPHLGVHTVLLVVQGEVEIERDTDDIEDRDLAVRVDEAAKVGLIRRPLLQLEIDACHDRDAAAGHPEIDGDGGPELERRLALLHAIHPDRDAEVAAAAKERDGEEEGRVLGAEIKGEVNGVAQEGDDDLGPETYVLQAEDSFAYGWGGHR